MKISGTSGEMLLANLKALSHMWPPYRKKISKFMAKLAPSPPNLLDPDKIWGGPPQIWGPPLKIVRYCTFAIFFGRPPQTWGGAPNFILRKVKYGGAPKFGRPPPPKI